MRESDVLALINDILYRQGKPPVETEEQHLREAGFRSLDFSELALRVEVAEGRPIEFDAGQLRRIATVRDVVRFFSTSAAGG